MELRYPGAPLGPVPRPVAVGVVDHVVPCGESLGSPDSAVIGAGPPGRVPVVLTKRFGVNGGDADAGGRRAVGVNDGALEEATPGHVEVPHFLCTFYEVDGRSRFTPRR